MKQKVKPAVLDEVSVKKSASPALFFRGTQENSSAFGICGRSALVRMDTGTAWLHRTPAA